METGQHNTRPNNTYKTRCHDRATQQLHRQNNTHTASQHRVLFVIVSERTMTGWPVSELETPNPASAQFSSHRDPTRRNKHFGEDSGFQRTAISEPMLRTELKLSATMVRTVNDAKTLFYTTQTSPSPNHPLAPQKELPGTASAARKSCPGIAAVGVPKCRLERSWRPLYSPRTLTHTLGTHLSPLYLLAALSPLICLSLPTVLAASPLNLAAAA